jgi:hypothetical protein
VPNLPARDTVGYSVTIFLGSECSEEQRLHDGYLYETCFFVDTVTCERLIRKL